MPTGRSLSATRTEKAPFASGVTLVVEMGVLTSSEPCSVRSVTVRVDGTLSVSRFRTTPKAFTVSVERKRDRSLVNSCHHSSWVVGLAQDAQYRLA